MNFFRRLNKTVATIESWLLVGFIFLMVGLSFLQVVLRNFFSSGFTWADVSLRNMVLWVSFIGASLAIKTNRHISIDVITKFLSDRWKWRVNILTSSFSFLMSLVFVWASYRFVSSEYEAQSIAFLGIPFWMIELIIPVGFLLISFRFLMNVIEDIDSLK